MRRSLSAKERLRLFTLHNGTCHLCGFKIDATREAWDVEHVIALELSRDDSDENRKPAHRKCHAAKTKEDAGLIAKAKRREQKHLGIRPRPRSSRPMAGGRNSKLKKKISGEVVLRDG